MLTAHIRAFIPRAVNFGSWFKTSRCYIRAINSYTIVVLSACSTALPINATAHESVWRDVQGYAIASCLTFQKQAYLKDQGDGWASVIVQRSKGDINALTAVAAVVKKEVAKGDMAIIRNENGPAQDKALPVEYCFEIIHTPSVSSAIKRAVKKLKPSYK